MDTIKKEPRLTEIRVNPDQTLQKRAKITQKHKDDIESIFQKNFFEKETLLPETYFKDEEKTFDSKKFEDFIENTEFLKEMDKKLISYIILEIGQNASRYHNTESKIKPTIKIEKKDKNIIITTKNSAKNTHPTKTGEEISTIDEIKKSIDNANNKKKEELDTQRKEQQINGITTRKNGGGVGFIDIARKIKKRDNSIIPFNFSFEKDNTTEDSSIINIEVKVPYQGTTFPKLEEQAETNQKAIIYKESLYILGKILKNHKWALGSSGGLFFNKENINNIPNDIDIHIDTETFNYLQKDFQNKKEIKNFKITNIEGEKLHTDKEIKNHVYAGECKLSFDIETPYGKINIEGFPEPKGRGLIQLGEMTKHDELKDFYVEGEKIKVLPSERITQGYFINFINEYQEESEENKTSKSKFKTSKRLHNIMTHVEETGIHNLQELINKMEDFINEYQANKGEKILHTNKKGEQKEEEYSSYLKKAIEGFPKIKKEIQEMIEIYKLPQEQIKKGEQINQIPPFEEFIKEISDIKKELQPYFLVDTSNEEIKKTIIKKLEKGRDFIKKYSKINHENLSLFPYFFEIINFMSNYYNPLQNKILTTKIYHSHE